MPLTPTSPINTKPNILLPTYRVAFKGLDADAYLAVSLRGNDSKVVRITKVHLAKLAAAQAPVRIVKTSSPAHGGTFTTPTPIPLDSLDPVAQSVVKLYTVEPVIGDEAIGQVWQVDGAVFVDETTDANDVGDDDWLIFPVSDAISDYMALGFSEKFGSVTFDNNSAGATAGVGGVVVWEYWNGTVWAALAGVVDGTTGFTIAKADGQVLTFDIPLDWASQVLNGSADLFYIRARITTVFSTNPSYDQGFIAAVGTEVGSGSVFEQDVAITTEVVTEKFGGAANAKPPILRGTQETLEIHVSADGVIDGFIEWTEN